MTDPKKPAESKPPVSAGAAETSFFGDVVKWARSKASPEADRGMTDMVTQAAKMFYSTVYGDLGKPGDQRFGQDLAARLDAYMDENGKPKDFGKYDLMMAAGWHPKGSIKVNGVETTLTKPIDNMLAVFIRNKDGSVEIIDPSIKVNKLTEIPRVLDALTAPGIRKTLGALPLVYDADYKKMALTETPADQRWRDTAGTFVMVQLAPMLATGGLSLLGKGGATIISKAPQLERVGHVGSKINQAAITATIPVTAATAASGVTTMADQMGQNFYFSPQAINKIVEGVANTLKAPTINADAVRKNMNEALHEFSYNQGSDAKQIYIPSLLEGQQPWTRMQQTLQGLVQAQEKPNHPWQSWQDAKRIDIPDIREAMNSHPGVRNAFYSSVEKHLTGQKLTDRDIFVMRTGLKLGPDDDFARMADINPVGKSGTLKYTAEERDQTLQYVDDQLKTRLRDKVVDDPAVAKKMGINRDDVDIAMPEFTPAQIKNFVSGEVKESGGIIEAQRQEDLRKAQAYAMAFTIR